MRRHALVVVFVAIVASALSFAIGGAAGAAAPVAMPFDVDARRSWHQAHGDDAEAPVARPKTGSKSICAESIFDDPSSDVARLDVVRFGFHYDCEADIWVFVVMTDDAWDSSTSLDVLAYNVDVDGDSSNSCDGGEYTVLGYHDGIGLTGGLIRTPSCSSDTWSDAGPAFVDRSGGPEFLLIGFEASQLGAPSSFRTFGLLANLDGEVDGIPDAGWAAVCCARAATTSTSTSTTTTTRPTTTTTRPTTTTTTIRRTTTTTRPPTSGGGVTADGVSGYWILDGMGAVSSFGDASGGGPIADCTSNGMPTCTAIASPGGNGGYWVLHAATGAVTAHGGAPTLPGWSPNGQAPISLAPTASGDGYWLLGQRGAVQVRGDAAGFGEATVANAAFRQLVPTPTGRGYWLLGEDGGVFTYGDAAFFGSTGAMQLNAPIVGMAVTATGRGYWLVGADGGIFTFGDARFLGSTGAIRLAQPIRAMAATPSGNGYALVAADGGLFRFGDAPFHGSAAGSVPTNTVVGFAFAT